MVSGNFLMNSVLTEIQLRELAEMYVDGFSGPPWFETWEVSAAFDYLQKAIDSNIVVLAMCHDGGISGFGIGMRLENYGGKEELISFGANLNDLYVSEIVVNKNYRKKGIALSMMHLLASHAHTDSQALLFRTHVDNHAMRKVAENLNMDCIAEYCAETGGKASQRIVFRR